MSGRSDGDILVIRTRSVRSLGVEVDLRVGLDDDPPIGDVSLVCIYHEIGTHPVLVKFIIRGKYISYHPIQGLELEGDKRMAP